MDLDNIRFHDFIGFIFMGFIWISWRMYRVDAMTSKLRNYFSCQKYYCLDHTTRHITQLLVLLMEFFAVHDINFNHNR